MRIYLLLLITFLGSACSPRLMAPPDPTQVDPPAEAPAAVRTPDAVPDQILELAIDHLSKRLSLDPKSIHLIWAESVLWPDSALGCPQQGETYAQETVPGFQIILLANDRRYLYHTDTDQTVILCMQEDLPSFPVTPGEIDDGVPWMPVD